MGLRGCGLVDVSSLGFPFFHPTDLFLTISCLSAGLCPAFCPSLSLCLSLLEFPGGGSSPTG